MAHLKDKEVLLEQLLTVKDQLLMTVKEQLLVAKDTMRLQYENKVSSTTTPLSTSWSANIHLGSRADAPEAPKPLQHPRSSRCGLSSPCLPCYPR